MEIVSEPDMSSADEAIAYLTALKEMLVYAGVSDCNLEEGNMRSDVNISIRPVGETKLGTKVEIKNMNSFRGIHAALEYEARRQRECMAHSIPIIQETRRWDGEALETASMRTKENAHDYRYFPEPDLVPVALSEEQIEAWRKLLPEKPEVVLNSACSAIRDLAALEDEELRKLLARQYFDIARMSSRPLEKEELSRFIANSYRIAAKAAEKA